MAPFLFREVFPAPYSVQGLAARLPLRGPGFMFSCNYCFLSEACASHTCPERTGSVPPEGSGSGMKARWDHLYPTGN